jgi:hypothetical protein
VGQFQPVPWLSPASFTVRAAVQEPVTEKIVLSVTAASAFQGFVALRGYVIYVPDANTYAVTNVTLMPTIQLWGTNTNSNFVRAQITAIAFDQTGALWIGLENGAIWKASSQASNPVQQIRANPEYNTYGGGIRVNSIAFDTDGTVYYTQDTHRDASDSVFSISPQSTPSSTTAPTAYSALKQTYTLGVGVSRGFLYLAQNNGVKQFQGGQGSFVGTGTVAVSSLAVATGPTTYTSFNRQWSMLPSGDMLTISRTAIDESNHVSYLAQVGYFKQLQINGTYGNLTSLCDGAGDWYDLGALSADSTGVPYFSTSLARVNVFFKGVPYVSIQPQGLYSKQSSYSDDKLFPFGQPVSIRVRISVPARVYLQVTLFDNGEQPQCANFCHAENYNRCSSTSCWLCGYC